MLAAPVGSAHALTAAPAALPLLAAELLGAAIGVIVFGFGAVRAWKRCEPILRGTSDADLTRRP